MDRILELGLLNAVMAAVLALLAVILGRVFRRPAVRHGLWLLVLLKLVTPPLWEWPIELPIAIPTPMQPRIVEMTVALPEAPTVEMPLPGDFDTAVLLEDADVPVAAAPPGESALTPPAEEALATAPAAAPPQSQPWPWKALVWWVWLAGSLVWFSMALRRLWRFHRLLREAEKAPLDIERSVDRLAGLLGLRGRPRVRMVSWPTTPMLYALGPRAILLIPKELWRRLDPVQQETLLTHELVHLRRRDHWVRRLEFLALGLYFWHPVVWWARRQLRDAEEECCDAWVISSLPAARAAYAATLVETVSFLSERRPPLPLLASGAGHVRFLQRRLSMIMHESPRGRLSWVGLFALLVLATLLLWQPTLAQPADPAPVVPPPVVSAPPPVAPVPPVAQDPAGALPPAVAQPPLKPYPTAPAPVKYGYTASQEDASDEVELLRVQLSAKQAELKEARVLVDQAKRQFERVSELGRAVSNEEKDQARTEMELREARLQGKAANVKEAELRLSQAERRAKTWQQRGGDSKPMTPSSTVPAYPASPAPPSAEGPATTTKPRMSRIPTVMPPTVEAPPPAYGSGTTKTPTDVPRTPLFKPSERAPVSTAAPDRDHRLRELEAKMDNLTKELAALRKLLQDGAEDRGRQYKK